MTGERFEGRESALQRAAVDPFRSPAGEKSAQIGRGAIDEIGDSGRAPESFLEKGEKLPGVAAISFDRARRRAPLMGEMVKPGGRGRGEIRGGGEGGEFGRWGGVRHGEDGAMERLSGGCGLRDEPCRRARVWVNWTGQTDWSKP